MSPTVSVVIPVYNRPEDLRRALRALVGQTQPAFEVIVCDDGSTVDVAAVASEFAALLPLSYRRLDNSGGPARPRNTGVGLARGEWIAFLDSDDWWDPQRMARVVAHLTADVDVLYHPLRLVGPNGPTRRGGKGTVGEAMVGDALWHMACIDNPIPNSAVIVRRSLLERIGGLCEDSDLVAYEDFDAWLRLAEQGARFRFLNAILGSYWLSPDAISAVSPRAIARQKALYRRHAAAFAPFARAALAKQQYTLASLASRFPDNDRVVIGHLLAAQGLVGFVRNVRRLARLVGYGLTQPRLVWACLRERHAGDTPDAV